jgi:uncharacterized protein YoxC
MIEHLLILILVFTVLFIVIGIAKLKRKLKNCDSYNSELTSEVKELLEFKQFLEKQASDLFVKIKSFEYTIKNKNINLDELRKRNKTLGNSNIENLNLLGRANMQIEKVLSKSESVELMNESLIKEGEIYEATIKEYKRTQKNDRAKIARDASMYASRAETIKWNKLKRKERDEKYTELISIHDKLVLEHHKLEIKLKRKAPVKKVYESPFPI